MSEPPPSTPPLPHQGPPDGPPRRAGLSDTAKFWIGVPLAVPVLLLVAIIIIGVPFGGRAPGALVLVSILLLLVALVVAIAVERTRYVALGVLAGIAVILVLLAGACVAILTGSGG